jgi:hypothetical protein
MEERPTQGRGELELFSTKFSVIPPFYRDSEFSRLSLYGLTGNQPYANSTLAIAAHSSPFGNLLCFLYLSGLFVN